VVLLSTLLVAKTTWRRRRTEVGAAIASAWSAAGWATHPWARREAAATGTWTPKATTTAAEAAATGSRPAESARARGKPAASRWTRWTIFARARLADRKRPPLERLRVELLDDFFGNGAVPELDECETARTTGLAIDRHGDVGWLGDSRQVSAKVGLTCPVGEVSDEQTDCQDLLVRTALGKGGVRF
jgi:hypothetical protein